MEKNIGVFKSNSCFEFVCGEKLPNIELIYETYGEINSDKTNAVLVVMPFLEVMRQQV